ncbi:hypothetical protein [Variovorax sp. PBL-H6]|uniref:hypothetical protein n=1 Tax=Variovorax sp. PBL-H6 TaxID=434009 RepID=UPI0013A5A0ED|nr:hypothetical protein [Variovorax sp. PBL-H6]
MRAALEAAFKTRYAVRLWFGDTKTGRAWPEQDHVIGQIGRSAGKRKLPLLASADGEAELQIEDQCIVRIDLAAPGTLPGSSVYRHQAFHTGDWAVSASDKRGYAEDVLNDGKVLARFKQNGAGARYIDFLTGASNAF